MDNFKIKEDPPEEESKRTDIGCFMFALVIIVVFGGYIAIEWFSGGSESDCYYTDRGCQENSTRWGQ